MGEIDPKVARKIFEKGRKKNVVGSFRLEGIEIPYFKNRDQTHEEFVLEVLKKHG